MLTPTIEFMVAESHLFGHGRHSPLEICSDLDVAVQPDLRYHFCGPLCAAYWIDLCRTRDYWHDRVIATIENFLPKVVDVLQNDSGRRTKVNVLSLGPGDGEVDIRVLTQLRRELEVVSYRCVDFSFELLEYAVRRIKASGAIEGLPVRALCADFAHRERSGGVDGARALLLLTGYTIGNNDEARVLAEIVRWMKPGDYLLLDGHLHALAGKEDDPTPEQRRSLVRGYDNPASNRFVFGPVETVTTARPHEVEFDYRIGRSVTTIPRAFNVVIGCSGLAARMRLTGEPVAREHLDLASTTLYDFECLRDWLAATPLKLRLAERGEETGVFLLQKTSDG